MTGQGVRPSASRVPILNVNHPGSATQVDAGKYYAMRDAILKVLPSSSPGLTPAEMLEAVVPFLPEDIFPGGEGASWWAKAVQLDLEARRAIERETKRPVRLRRLLR